MNPTTHKQAFDMIMSAKAHGVRVLCSNCRADDATLLLSCPDGTVQGTACPTCWAKHQDFIQFSMILVASDMVDDPICSRCGTDPVPADHIITTDIT